MERSGPSESCSLPRKFDESALPLDSGFLSRKLAETRKL